MNEELKEAAYEAMKEGVSSATSGAGSATYGGAGDEEEEETEKDCDVEDFPPEYIWDDRSMAEDKAREIGLGAQAHTHQGFWMPGPDHETFEDYYESMSTAEKIAAKMADQASTLAKYRVYVDDPSEVPEEYEVQEGTRGGYYYEVEGTTDAEQEGRNVQDFGEHEEIPYEGLEPGMEVVINGNPATIQEVQDGKVTYVDETEDEEYTIFADMIDGVAAPGEFEEPSGFSFEDRFTEVEDGVYAEVEDVDLDPFLGEDVDQGDEVLINGDVYEVTSASSMRGPDGEYYFELEFGNDTMWVRTDSVEGMVTGDSYNVGDYEVDNEVAAKFAEAANEGDVVQDLNAREIVVNVGKIEDEELVFDMLEAQYEDGYVSAERKLRGRARALGYSEDEIDQRLGITPEIPPDHAAFKEAYTEDNIVDEGPLPGAGGVNRGAMTYVELENGEHAFKKDYTHPAIHDIGGRDNALVSYAFQRELLPDEGAEVPPYKRDEGGDWLVKKDLDGEMFRSCPRDWEDKTGQHAEELTEAYAVHALVGNNDLHAGNQLIDSEGNVKFIDNDDCQDREKGYTDSGLDSIFRRMSIPSGVRDAHGGTGPAKSAIYQQAVETARELEGSDRLEEIKEMARNEAYDGDDVVEDVVKTIEYLAADNYNGRFA